MSEAASDTVSSVLVTGGAGFIGQHLVSLLAESGFTVRVLDLAPPPAVREVEYHQGSILDPGLMKEACAGVGAVFHLAANPNLWAPDPATFMEVNYAGTVAVLDAARDAGVEKIIYTSTESILVGHRRGEQKTITEEVAVPLAAMTGEYCRSKWLAEEAAASAAEAGMPVVIVNPTMPLGPDDPNLTPPTRMLLDFVNGELPAYFDFEMNLVDVRDAALGHLLAWRDGKVGRRYILGGSNVRLGELLRVVEQLTETRMPRATVPYELALATAYVSEFWSSHVTRRPPRATVAGVKIAGSGMCLDNSRARDELGFTPRALEDTLRDTLAWLQRSGLSPPAAQRAG